MQKQPHSHPGAKETDRFTLYIIESRVTPASFDALETEDLSFQYFPTYALPDFTRT